jgi:hypothetical protein
LLDQCTNQKRHHQTFTTAKKAHFLTEKLSSHFRYLKSDAQITWTMSRSGKKHSSGFYDDNDNSNMKKSSRHKNVANGETSSSRSDYWRKSNGAKYRLPTPPPAPILSPYRREEIEIVNLDSDSEEEISYDNNNEEASPDRHRVQEDRESIDTEKREDSNSSDVIFVEDSTDDIEKLSWIVSDGSKFSCKHMCAISKQCIYISSDAGSNGKGECSRL